MLTAASVVVGIATLRSNPLRTVLSTLGVIIGVAALVAILALGDGLETYLRSQIESTTDIQVISVDARLVDRVDGMLVRRADPVTLGPARADSLAATLAGRADVALAMTSSAWYAPLGDTARRATMVFATTGAAAAVFRHELAAGRLLAAADSAARPVPAVVSASLARQLDAADSAVVGRQLRLDGSIYEVVGVLRGPADAAARLNIPLNAATIARLGDGGRQAPTLAVRARRVEDVVGIQREVEAWLGRYGDLARNFTVQSYTRRAAQARQGIVVFKLVMGAITGISILVGGIGIMNILLASVAERTREIGIRKSVGARRGDIMVQFLAESVTISGVGAFIGVVIGLGGAFGITAIVRRATEAHMYAAFTWGTVFVAAIAALLVGIVFGTYPATRAARLSPIEAIRHE